MNTNDPPIFLSEPMLRAVIQSVYSYNVVVADPDEGDVPELELGAVPEGAVLVGQTLTWTPTIGQQGAQSFTLRLHDGEVSIEQTFVIEVAIPNGTGPVINGPLG